MGFVFLRNEKTEIANDSKTDLIIPEWNIIIKDSILGTGVSLWSNLNIYGAIIGENTKLSSFIEIRKDVQIGRNCKIEPFVFIPEGVTIKDGVFIGPNVTFTNDIFPKACDDDGKLVSDYRIVPTLVNEFASIGAGCVIRCGVTIGKKALIGAGSVIVKNVKAHELWYGKRAKKRGKIEWKRL
ncbi:N-acetyltransferase [bacterium]|nr:N-acetyltransferase [bacterium]